MVMMHHSKKVVLITLGDTDSTVVPDKSIVRMLKADLDNGARFSKADREYIEAAHERLGKGLSLSPIQSQAVRSVVQLEASTDDSE